MVIGGAGLIGSHTVEKLLKEDVKEVVVDQQVVKNNGQPLIIHSKDKTTSAA